MSDARHVVTLDADLQNPPEEIGKLLAKAREGYDYVGTYRRERQDSWLRRRASQLMNALRERITDIRMTDQGCMLRAYARNVVDAINRSPEANTFIPRSRTPMRAIRRRSRWRTSRAPPAARSTRSTG